MAKIRMLPEGLIGKIAAGEVVERPAAAIKELVENSLDAGAERITVEIEDGGITSFRVTDNGSGIDEGDIRLAFERHATSKIRDEADLNAIGTLGFRGEALASIAAVSHVTLTTRTRERETGLRVKNEGGRILEIREAACAPGTSILVQELFYNVPVRRQFLKKPAAEANAVTDLMVHLILSRPQVSFRYVRDGRQVYHSPGDGKIGSAMLTIYGSALARTMRPLEGNAFGVLIRGYVAVGENARNNRAGEHFFINGRMFRSPLISGAVEDACRERVMIGKYPVCALYLEMPYENVNVNVHPNKMEVRFKSDFAVRDAVYQVVYEALKERDAFERPVEMPLTEETGAGTGAAEPVKRYAADVPARELPRATVETASAVPGIRMEEAAPMPVYRPIEGKREPAAEAVAPQETLPAPKLTMRGLRDQAEGRPAESADGGTGTRPWDPSEGAPAGNADGGTTAGPAAFSPSAARAEAAAKQRPADSIWRIQPLEEQTEQISSLPENMPKPMKVFGAVFNTFILIEYEDHLLLVDQHAAHERLLFDRMMKAYEEQRAGQELLVPYIVSVTENDLALLEEHRDLLEGLGLTVEPFSRHEVAVRSVPVVLGQQETADFLHEAIDALENGRMPGADKKRAAILQTACKHAVKGGEPLPEAVLRSLVEELIEKKVTPTCPHGRPLVVSISHLELDKKFKRIQQ